MTDEGIQTSGVPSDRSVKLSLTKTTPDRHVAAFTLLVDLTAPRKTIARDLNAELRRYLPYRTIDPLLYDALELRAHEGITYCEASRRLYGHPRRADAIRYLANKTAAVRSCREF